MNRTLMRYLQLSCLLNVVSALTCDVVQSQVDLSPFLNNKAAVLTGYSTANFDNHNGSYPAEYLPQGLLNEANIEYQLPNWSSPIGVNDNINCSGQTIELPRGRYHSFNFLGATDGTASDTVNGEFVAIYDSGETEKLGFVVPPWWSRNPSDG
jgi:alpha-L-fucosidase